MSINPLELFFSRMKENIEARLKDYTDTEKLDEITRFLNERSITTITAQELLDKLLRTPDALVKDYISIMQEIIKDNLEELEATLAIEAKQGVAYQADDTLTLSNDTEITEISNTDYTKKKEIRILTNGLYRIKFDLGGGSGGFAVYGKLYKNAGAFGTERATNEDAYTTYSEDLYLSTGDLLQLYVKRSIGGTMAKVRNLRLYASFVLIAGVNIITG